MTTTRQAKHTQAIPRNELLDVLAVARNEQAADLRIDNVKIMNLVSGGYMDGPIVIKHDTIVGFGPEYANHPATKVVDAQGHTAVPGFIDAHMHIESSIMAPQVFESLTLPLGLTTIVCDPHEVINVIGTTGLEWFLRSSAQAYQNQFIQMSSCVPALPNCEINGAEFTVDQMKDYIDSPYVLGLAEMMNFPGVINGDPLVLDKIALFAGLAVDGHAPTVSGRPLDAYIAAGIGNDHECTTKEEALEKLAKGVTVFMREASVARNLDALAPILNEYSSAAICLCTDDITPYDMVHTGHIDAMVRRLIQKHGVKPHLAYRVSSYTTAQHYGLKRLGLIAPGRKADIVLVSDVENVTISKVFVGGKDVSELNLVENAPARLAASNPPTFKSVIREPLREEDFAYEFEVGKKYRAVEVIHDEIITGEEHLTCTGFTADGNPIFDKPAAFLTTVERYGHQVKPAFALVTATGLTRGGLASSVGHDSHNLTAMGATRKDLVDALNAIIATNGGFSAVLDGEVKAHLALPIAGVLSTESAAFVHQTIEQLKAASRECGVFLHDPFMQLSFLPLPVIPKLKLTCNGLFDVTQFKFVPLEVE
ncbi:adenine deaminase [Psittacicella melopsittaci]|uniref:Adenine deaminase n=1 Tax=Psittacicella melopsittaci TaxID=2028576 RepID=A0A3A1Y9A5_9GAMM|nr:adenine deaminase [Psittacicella melopsittaci]RIY33906.1 adenine deaminase [Psittacicella melopsittaci]